MAQGTRGRLLLAAVTGFGVVLCTGLVGCQNTDKAKDTKVATKQPGPYLPGTPRLDSTGTANKTQPYYGAPGSNIQPAGGTQISPGSGLGAGAAQYPQTQFGSSNGNNPLNTTAQPQNFGGMNGSNVPGAPGTLGAPAKPGSMYSQPVGAGPLGAAPPSTGGGVTTVGSSPKPVDLLDMQLPPGPLPPSPPSFGPSGGAVAVGPIAPPAPIPSALPPIGTGANAKPSVTSGFSGAGVFPNP